MKKKYTSTYKGLPLVDAAEDLDICVTKQDVSTARKKDSTGCAAANALKRVLKTEAEVHLSRTYIKDAKNKVWVRFKTPESVSREITSFDRAAIFEPGDYTLKAPSAKEKLGIYKGRSTPKTGAKRRAVSHQTINVRESAHKGMSVKNNS